MSLEAPLSSKMIEPATSFSKKLQQIINVGKPQTVFKKFLVVRYLIIDIATSSRLSQQ